MPFIEITSTDIGLLDSTKLPELLRRLLNLEAQSHNIPRTGLNVAGSITTPDGGVDGSIIWQAPPDFTSQLPSNNLVFQSKAQGMTSTAAGGEVENASNTNIKPMVDRALSNGAGYILFTTQNYTDQQRESAIGSIRAKFQEYSKPYAATALIDVYDRQKIRDWVNDFLPAIVTVKGWRGITIPGNFWSFEQWREFLSMEDIQYFEDISLADLRSQVQKLLGAPGSATRLVGPSGIGKTRLLFEACKAENDTDRIIYCDAASDEAAVMQYVQVLNTAAKQCTLIIDNCPLDLHSMISRRLTPTLTLITIDHNNDLTSGSGELIIPPVDDSVIRQIVLSGWPDIEADDLSFVMDYAGGFPLIATTLARDTADGAENRGMLNDDTIKRRLLGAEATPADIAALEVMSLINYIGFENRVSDQYRYVAEHIAGINPNDFYRSIQKFERRQIIDSRGDYKRVKPLPLAIRLAADWWGNNSPDHVRRIIDLLSPDVSPPQLSDSFCKAVAKLNFVERAVEVTAEFCGQKGPFVQAGLLKTVWGSKLFRSFVEVNPKATSKALYIAISSETYEELSSAYSGDVRRNLYWALEMLCFRAEVFEQSCWSLLRLSVAENESWGNNCSNLFKQLFAGFLSGTEAGPKLRLRVIRRALLEADERVDSLVIGALEAAVDDGYRTRTVGAENQGLNQKLEEWRPAAWGELFQYQDESLRILFEYAKRDSDVGVSARAAISNTLRGMIRRRDHKVLYDGLDELIEKLGGECLAILDSIRSIRIYELDSMPDEIRNEVSSMLDRWEEGLSPKDLKNRILQLVDKPSWDHLKDKDGEIIDQSEERAVEFAKEFSNRSDEFIPYADILTRGELRKGYLFAHELAGVNSDHDGLLDGLVGGLRLNVGSGSSNPTVFSSYLNSIKETQPKLYESYTSLIFNDDELCVFYIDCIRYGGIDENELNNILSLIKGGRLEVFMAKNLAYGSVTRNLSPESMTVFARSLVELDNKNSWIALNVVYMYVHESKEKWDACEGFFVELIGDIEFSDNASLHTMDMHHWEVVCKKLIDKQDDRVITLIAGRVFVAVIDENSISSSDHSIHVVLNALIEKGHYEIVLSELEQALRFESPFTGFSIGNLLSGSIRSSQHGHLLDIPEDVLMKWAEQNPDIGPSFIAKASPLYSAVDDSYVCHSLTIKIADKYGDDVDVLNNLSSFAGFKSWSGSRIPDMMGEKAAYEYLSQHENHVVREWAQEMLEYISKDIDSETRRAQERDFGIY